MKKQSENIELQIAYSKAVEKIFEQMNSNRNRLKSKGNNHRIGNNAR